MNELTRINKLESEVALLGRRLTLVEKTLPRNLAAEVPWPEMMAQLEAEAAVADEQQPASSWPETPQVAEPTAEFPEASFSPPVPPITPPINAPISWLEQPVVNGAAAGSAHDSPGESWSSNEPKSLLDWENLIGGKWALWIGSLCLFLAFASFLAYTWRYLPPPPPWAKVAMGLGAGALLLGAGEWFRSSTQKWFSEGLSGAGLSLCYLSVWAATGFFHIMSSSVAFGGMACLTALGVALAVRAKAPALSILSTIGNFLTPVLLESGQHGVSQGMALLTYVAVLDMGIVAVSLFQRWRGLTWMSFVGTFLLVGGWTTAANIAAMRGPLFFFLSLYFVLFLSAACFYSLARQEETAPEDLLLLFTASSLFAPAGYAVLQPVLGHFQGIFALGLALFWGLMAAAVHIMAPRNVSLRTCLGGLSLLALTVALPMQLKGPWLAVGWSGEAGLLLLLSRRLNSSLFLRAGQTVWALAGFGVMIVADSPVQLDRIMAWGAFLLVSAGASYLARRDGEGQLVDELEPLYASACLWGSAWLLGRETYSWLHGAPAPSHREAYAWLFIAPLEALLALLAFAVGLRARYQLVRVEALTLAVISAFTVLIAGITAPLTSPLPFSNARPAAFVVMALLLGVLGWLIGHTKDELPTEETETLQAWPVVTAAFVLLAASIEAYFALTPRWGLDAAESTTLAFMLSVLWSSYAAALLGFAATARNKWLRGFGWGVMGIGISAAIVAALAQQSAGLPLLNWRFAAYGAAILSLCIAAKRARLDNIESGTFVFLALMLGLAMVSQESYETCRHFATALGPNWARVASMMISLVWSVYGAAMLLGGIVRGEQQIRLVALGLLCLTVLKIFLFDLAFLNGPWRAVSLGGMGVTLIFISWLYSRYGAEKNEVGDTE